MTTKEIEEDDPLFICSKCNSALEVGEVSYVLHASRETHDQWNVVDVLFAQELSRYCSTCFEACSKQDPVLKLLQEGFKKTAFVVTRDGKPVAAYIDERRAEDFIDRDEHPELCEIVEVETE